MCCAMIASGAGVADAEAATASVVADGAAEGDGAEDAAGGAEDAAGGAEDAAGIGADGSSHAHPTRETARTSVHVVSGRMVGSRRTMKRRSPTRMEGVRFRRCPPSNG